MTNTANTPENRMGTMPVGRLLATISFPMIVSMLVQALYNIVDSMFVAKLSENALTAVSLAFPAQNLMIAVATGTGVGVNALLSKSLGEKKFDIANRTAVNSLFLAGISSLVFVFLGIFFARTYYTVQTDIAEIVEGGTAYLRICCLCSFGVFFQIAAEKLLQSTGLTVYSMITQLSGAIVNIILDPILIFGLFGFPELGIAGAAVATVVGEMIGMMIGIFCNLRKNKEITLRLRGFRPDSRIIQRIYSVGVPSMVMASIGSVMAFSMNRILLSFTETAAAVFGVYFKLQSFVFMPVFGLNNGMVPIIAYNYGARRPARIRKTILFSALSASAIMILGALTFWFFAPQLLGIFEASPEMLAIGVPALRITGLCFVLAGFCIVTHSVCQALGQAVASLVMTVIRQLIILLPAAYILSRIGGLSAVWWAWPIAESISVTLCIIYMRRIFRTIIRPLEAETAA